MERRKFLGTAAALSTGVLAGCQGSDGGGGGTEETEEGTDGETDSEDTDGEGTTEDGDGGSESDELPRLRTDGEWVVDEDGNEVVLRGINLVEPLFADMVDEDRGGDHVDTLELALDEDAGWYNRVVRVPITYWGVQGDGVEEHYDGEMEAYFEDLVDPTVERCREENTYVIVDYHLIRDWQDNEELGDLIEEFWEFAAPRYADEPHVLYEFFNEPDAPAEDSLENWNAWKEEAQPWVDMIREHAPDTPIIVGSPEWTSLTKHAAESPFEGENLIYAGHIYPGDGRSAEEWDADYGEPADEVPVMITEWGYDATNDIQPGTTSDWGEPFREWLDGRENVGWTAWCFDSHWGPIMFDQDLNLRGGDLFHGRFVKEWLFDLRNDRVPEVAQSGEDAELEPLPDVEDPEAPTNVDLTENEDGTVTVTWDHDIHGDVMISHYDVFVDGDHRDQLGIVSLVNEQAGGDFTADEYSFETTLSGFKPGETYEIYLTAIDSHSNESLPTRFLQHSPSGELETHAEIPRIDAAPSIDAGIDDAWADVPAHDLENVAFGELDGEDDLAATWQAAWDDDALYVLVDAVDDALGVDGAEAYNNDSIELFLDGDNSKLPDYDGTNDYQIIFERETGDLAEGVFPKALDEMEYAQAETDDGWRLEVAIPWSMLDVDDPGAEHLIGFDAHVNDDDEGGDRSAKITWFDEDDQAWDNPSVIGNVELIE